MADGAGILNAVGWQVGAALRVGERHVVRSLLLRHVRWRVVGSERGASLVEYALLLALIALVCIGALALLGGEASTPLSTVSGSLGGS